MSKIDVVGIGFCTLDILIRLDELPTWQQRVQFEQISFDGGGQTGTGLCAAAKLGAKTGFIGTAGTDWFAETKLQSLVDCGIDISHVVRRPGPDNQVVCVLVNRRTGDRIFNSIETIRTNLVEPGELDRTYITQAQYLLTEGYHYEATLAAAEWMHSAGKRVMYDGVSTSAESLPEKQINLVKASDILICGEGFAEALTGEKDRHQAGQAALSFGPELVVITEGEKGSFLFSREESFHTPAFDVEVVDTTGAGDAFHGAFLVGLLKGWDYRKICTFAAAVSAIECTYLGGRSGLPTFPQVAAFLQQRGFAF